MNQKFFIIQADGQKIGPFDIVSIVKKIRNGGVSAETMICTDKDSSPKAASSVSELSVFISEQEHKSEVESTHVVSQRTVSLFSRLGSGWSFLQHNQLCTIFSGLFVLYIIFMTGAVKFGVPKVFQLLVLGAVFLLIQYVFTGYIYSVLRMVRGQPVDIAFVRGRMKPYRKPLLITSLIMSLFLIIGFMLVFSGDRIALTLGMLIIVLPGFLTLSFLIFAPLLILDKEMDFWEAMEMSRKVVKKSGLENIGIIFSLLMINFLAGLVFLIPLIISLPITLAGISEMYDEYFI